MNYFYNKFIYRYRYCRIRHETRDDRATASPQRLPCGLRCPAGLRCGAPSVDHAKQRRIVEKARSRYVGSRPSTTRPATYRRAVVIAHRDVRATSTAETMELASPKDRKVPGASRNAPHRLIAVQAM